MLPLPLCWFAMVYALAMPGIAQSGVVISEFLASNGGGLRDEDGNSPDWIELHNSGPEPVSLAGWSLSDDAQDRRKWEIPAKTLPAGGYLVIFASGKDRTDPAGELHTNFSLTSGGEPLLLINPGGAVQEYWPAQEQEKNISIGLLPEEQGEDGAAKRVAFALPSPGRANEAGQALASGVEVLPAGGAFYVPFTATLTTSSEGEIRYTLDGNIPSPNSPLYTGPLEITATTRLRARVFTPGRLPGPVRAETYLELAAGLANFSSSLPLVILDNFNAGHPDDAREAHWLMIPPDNSAAGGGRSTPGLPPAVSTRAMIRVRGSSTASAAKYSLAIEAQTAYGADRPVTPPGMPPESDWVLQAPYDYDRALIRNRLMYELSRGAGRYAPRSRQVEVFLNTGGGPVSAADYAGVFTLMEKIKRGEDRVAIRHLRPEDAAEPAVQGGYLLKIDRADPGDTGFSAAGQRIYWVDPKENEVTAAQRRWIISWLNGWWSALKSQYFFDSETGYAAWADAGSFVDHHLLNVTAKNVDAFRLSAYFFKDRYGRLTAGPLWDFDRSLDSSDERDNNHDTWRGETGDLGTDFFRYPWYSEMFRDTNFRQQWIDRLAEWRQTVFSPDHISGEIDRLAAEVREAAPRNFARWPERPPRYGGWQGEIDHLKTWLLNRLAWMDAQFTRPPVADVPGGQVDLGTRITLRVPEPAPEGSKIYYTTDGSDPRLFDDTQGQEIITDQFIGPDHPLRAVIPLTDPGPAWRDGSPGFDDTAWISGGNGVGYDIGTASPYSRYIQTSLLPPPEERRMKGVRESCLVRFRFQATAEQIVKLGLLKLRMRFDDGFAAWLNGVPVASANAPSSLEWNSGAAALNADDAAVVPKDFDIAGFAEILHPGENILAIQGLNYGVNSTDFLLQTELLGGYVAPDGPEVNPAALEYTGPLGIQEPTHLTARAWQPAGPHDPWPYTGAEAGKTPVFSRWSAPLRVSWVAGVKAPEPGQVVVSQILQRPPPLTAAERQRGHLLREEFEFLELTNHSPDALDLTGLRISGDVQFTVPPGPAAVLPAGGQLILAANPAALQSRLGENAPVLGPWRGHLRDSCGTVSLTGSNGNLLESFAFQSPPLIRAGAGFSLERTNLGADARLADSWRLSLDPGGGADSFAAWRRRWFSDDDAAGEPLADPDADGLQNLLEFALASSPFSPALPSQSGLIYKILLTEAGAPQFQVTCKRRPPGMNSWALQVSPDLSNWVSTNEQPAVEPQPDGTEIATWTLAAPVETEETDPSYPLPWRFVRLRFSVAP